MRLDALVINLNRFGDLLLSQPLLHDLHKAGRSTTLLCLEKYADTEGLLQFASPLLTVPDHLVSPEQADATRHELQAWAENLRATVQADHIINLTPSMPARLLATALAPAPEAVLGFGLDHKGRPRVDGLWPAFLHAAELRQSNAPFNLADMFRMTGAPLLGGLSGRLLSQPGSGLLSELGTEARETARRLLAHAPVIRHGFIGMQLGASEKRRQWPVSHFVELGKRIWQEEGICPVLLGEASERPLADEYARLTSTPFVDVVGQTNIFELGAVLREMVMLVTNNTGTMHLAAGLGLPLLSIFLATAQPCDTGPYLP
ncbi:glycosyltransferase family 9 protein, partial [Desulfovibrio sp.]